MTDTPTAVEDEQDVAVATQDMPDIAGPDDATGDIDGLAEEGAEESPLTTALDDLEDFAPDAQNLELLLDVDLKITVELGRTQMKFREVLNLSSGSIIELGKQVSEPVDIMVNGALLATGEVVVIDDHFAVRITKLLSRVERLKRVL